MTATVRNRVVNQPPAFSTADGPLLLGEKDAAKRLGVSVSYLRKSRSEGARKGCTPAPPFVRLDGRIYYRDFEIRAWVEGLSSQQAI
jgi:hypothetical protein